MACSKYLALGSVILATSIATTPLLTAADSQSATSTRSSINPVDVKAIQQALQQKAAAAAEAERQEGANDDQRTTLEGELRYSKAKLAAAQKRLAVQSAVNNSEQAEKAQQEIKDWQARIKSTQDQLNQLDAPKQSPLTGVADDIVLPGENLDVYVVEDPSFNGHYQVRRGGYILIPQVGRVFVAGKKISDAEGAIRKALETNQLQHCTVMVEKINGSDVATGPLVFLAGEFKNPRPYRIPPGTSQSLVSVILSAGGVTDKADLSHVRLMRVAANNGVVEEVNVQRILDGSGLSSDLAVSDGDVIMIPAGAEHVIYLTGNVKRPGTQQFNPGDHLSVYAAILQSGGFARFADLKKVYVLRPSDDGSKVRIPVNIVAIQRGQQPDVPLEGNDIVVVPEKFFSF